jgi:hypothetical protein
VKNCESDLRSRRLKHPPFSEGDRFGSKGSISHSSGEWGSPSAKDGGEIPGRPQE